MKLLKETISVCHHCFVEVPAQLWEAGGKVYISKTCPEHGNYKFLVEKDAWVFKKLLNPENPTERDKFKRLNLSVSYKCNLNCPVCYLPDEGDPDLTLDEIKKIISGFDGGMVKLCGGEPTIREDLEDILRFICSRGKVPLLITNGIKLADRGYVRRLKNAGLNHVAFSFNGFSDDVYEKLNGKPLFKVKMKALQNLIKENIYTNLCVLLMQNTNEGDLKKAFKLACRHRNFVMFKIGTSSMNGRYIKGQGRIYLSEIIDMMARIIGVTKEVYVEHSLAMGGGYHLPCRINVFPVSLYGGAGSLHEQLSFLQKLKVFFTFAFKIGLPEAVGFFVRHAKGSEIFRICIRTWPDKYRIDLNKKKRCQHCHYVKNTGEYVSFCEAVVLREGPYSL